MTPKLFALPPPTGPESRPPISAPRQIASNNPGTRDSNPAHSSHPAWSAESYRANAPDAATPHHRAIHPAPLSDRSDTCALPGTTGKKRFYSVLRIASGGGGKKFVAVDAHRDSAALVLRFHAQHARVTAYVHIARQCDLLRQGQDKLNRSARFYVRFNQKIKTAKTHVARFALLFQNVVFLGKPHFQRQHHRKPACGAAFFGAVHQPSGEALRCRHAITASRPGAMGFTLPTSHTRRTFPKFSRPP